MIKQTVQNLIAEATAKAGYDVPAIFNIDVPPRKEFGDYATNIALMINQREPQLLPRDIADNVALKLKESSIITKVEVAGPGFINITLSGDLYFNELGKILGSAENYGRSLIGRGKRVDIDYVSANPTGPLHIGNARGGPLGEAIANLLEFLGYDVTREFYVNDIGGQVNRLAESLNYWYEVKFDDRVSFPEGGYPAEYVKETSELIQQEKQSELGAMRREDRIELFKREGLFHLIKSIREDCRLLDINYDVWFYQSDLENSGKTDHVVDRLVEMGATVKKEGALWFKLSDDPELADRENVLRKSDEKGTYTYYADDVAYHSDRYENRGFDLIINIWGANHHGHVPRMKAAIAALGYPTDKLEVILYQYVRLKNGGEAVSMGKRLGNFATLRQVIEAGVAPDAFKYFILAQNPNTPFDFDVAQAADASEKNPVYYIKYAHARIFSILRKAGEQGLATFENADLKLLVHEKEHQLIKELVNFPELLLEMRDNYQIQALPHYAYKVAGIFHDFYTNCQVLSDDKKLTLARLSLVKATKHVLANSLLILDIAAPEKM